MLKVWGRATSANVQKVMWALGEMGVACERIDVGGPFGKNNEAAYLAMNPNGLVPTLEEDDGFMLWESNSVVRYLASRHGRDTLEPSDLRERAKANRWMDWQLTTVGPAIFPLFWGLIRTPEDKRDMAAIEAARAKVRGCMEILDRYLDETRYVAGDRFSMGDIPVAIMAYRYVRLSPDRAPLANFDRWYGEIAQRPAFKQQVLEIPFV